MIKFGTGGWRAIIGEDFTKSNIQILAKAIREDGYEGFLTLEPHLVLFATLQSLEVVDATEVISENKAKDGAEGYAMQYNALCDILKAI